MKVADVREEAVKELDQEKVDYVKGIIKDKYDRVEQARLTLKKLQEDYDDFLEKDVDEVWADRGCL